MRAPPPANRARKTAHPSRKAGSLTLAPFASHGGRRRATLQLPAPLTSLIGREREAEVVLALLPNREVRLVTLTGPGGVGKTRLALHVAGSVRTHYADGVAFVPLAPICHAEFVAPTIARALGIRVTGGQLLIDDLQTALHDQHLLLVLDNFEHVATAAPLIVDLLAGCPRLTVLVTSRESLRLSGEHDIRVPPLALPPVDRGSSVAELTDVAAVHLFVERAKAVRRDFALTGANASAVVEICRRLDGLPLAIELAAARIAILPPEALLARLEQRLPLLIGGPRDAPDRLRTVHNAIAWSHVLLSEQEQMIFRRLTVFVGGVTLDAAEAVAGGSLASSDTPPRCDPSDAITALDGTNLDAASVFDIVSSLVDKSLLLSGEHDGQPRLTMLEIIREFGLERLHRSGEEH